MQKDKVAGRLRGIYDDQLSLVSEILVMKIEEERGKKRKKNKRKQKKKQD